MTNDSNKKLNIKTKYFIAVFAILLILSVTTVFIVSKINSDSKLAEIVVDGTVVNTIDLNSVIEPYDIINTIDDRYNTVHIEKGFISISDANCPDKLCVNQGKIDSNVYPIVCLPHGLVVRIVSDTKNDEIDAISGN